MFLFHEFSLDYTLVVDVFIIFVFYWKEEWEKWELVFWFDCVWYNWIYLFWALVGGVGQSCISLGPIDIGVLGLVAPLPDKHAVPNGEHERRFDFRHDLFRNKSLKKNYWQNKHIWNITYYTHEK